VTLIANLINKNRQVILYTGWNSQWPSSSICGNYAKDWATIR